MNKLRARVADSGRPISARALANFLVEKQHLSQRHADDVLNALLASDTNIDDVPAEKQTTVADIDDAEVHDSETDTESGSSIFAPFLTGKPKKRVPVATPKTGSEDELMLLPDDDPDATDTTISSRREEARPVVDRPTTDEKPRKTSKEGKESKRRKTSTELADIDQAAAAAGDDAAQKPKRVGLRSKKKRWDSPLMLLGGGGLALLLISGATVWWLMIRESGDQQLALARSALKSGAYADAIENFQRFIEGSPRHPEHSAARVQLAMVELRQATESGKYAAALELAQSELKEIEDEPAFADEGHPELAALLPQIALGFAQQAEKTAPGDAAAAELSEQAQKTLELCNNVTYIPKTMRDEGKLAQVRELLALTAHRQQSHQALQAVLAEMQKATTDDKAAAAYLAHRKFVKEYSQLAADPGLVDALQKTVAADKAAIKFVADEHAAETSERPTPWIAALAVAHHQGPAAAAVGASGTTFVDVNGALYGLDAASGRLLWRRQLGYESKTTPLRIGGDVLVTDSARNELVRLDGATGRLAWRQAIGEPFAQPAVVGERAFLASESGRLHVVDLKTGTRAGFVQFAQSLRVPPAVDRLGEKLYVAGGHSSLYTIALADLSCIGVFYLGHAEGSISVPPAHVLDKLAVVENNGVETSQLHLMSLDDKGAVAKQETGSRLTGLQAAAPLVAGRRLLVVTDRGQIQVFDVASAEGEKALSRVATRDASGTEPLARHVAVVDRHVWIGDTQLTKYSILPTGNRLPVESIRENFAGSTFDHPLEVFGETLVHVHRPKGSSGAVVAATAVADGRVVWQTELAIPPAGPPIVDEQARSLTVCSAEGHLFAFGEAAIRSRVQDQPLAAQAAPPQLPAITAAINLGGGRAAFCAPGFDRLLLYNPSKGQGAAQWLKLESPLACAVTPLGDGFIAPLSVGQVFYLRSDNGAPLGVPFQPRLEPGT
ncbi:MAG TPA: PQQ-binding-like beta-propeller repeat protein, partial [Lacipirellulaceae bacterium]|nr:PQQ-binding-like beta-propeller repeat protein [Lacipirellulaceae bacterium]